MEKYKRIYQIDNIKFVLIFLVVFGHLCEQMSFKGSGYLYLLIYSFHMPAFVFLSGYCCKKSSGERICVKYLYPYFVFQTFYVAFSRYIMHQNIIFQYTTPYWLLWYLLSLFFWNLAILVISDSNRRIKQIVVVGSIMAIMVGYESTIAYYLSLSRTIVLFPFFLCGYYLKREGKHIFKTDNRKINSVYKALSILSVGITCFIILKNRAILQASWAYYSNPYRVQGDGADKRIFFFFTSIVFIIFLCLFVPKKKMGIITWIGQNTMMIFLLHGFIIRYLAYKNVLQTINYPYINIMVVTCGIILVCSCKPVIELFQPFIIYPWRK